MFDKKRVSPLSLAKAEDLNPTRGLHFVGFLSPRLRLGFVS